MSFAVFGEHEWATRLVPLVFSLSSLAVLYALAIQHFNIRVGLVASLLMTVVPMAAYYLGTFPDVQGPHVLFFMLLSFFCYFRWIESGKRGHFIGLALAVCFGILSDWPGVYTPLIIATYHRFNQRRDKLRHLIVLSAASVLLVIMLIWYLSWLVHDPWSIKRAVFGASIPTYSELRDWITTVLRHTTTLFTPVLLGLAVSCLIVERYCPVRNRYPYRYHLIWLLLAFGALHVVLGLRGAYWHNYWSMYLTPGLVLAAAVWINDLGDQQSAMNSSVTACAISSLTFIAIGIIGLYQVGPWLDYRISAGYFLAIFLFCLAAFIRQSLLGARWHMGNRAIALALVTFLLAAYGQVRMIALRDNQGGLGGYRAAQVLRKRTTPAEEILAGPSIAWGGNPPFTYYADRQFIKVDGIETFGAYQTQPRFRYLVLSKKEMDLDLIAHITPRFFAETLDRYLLVDLRRPL
jgi:4-amino-4-deoxy-L-arabinose transferase-like glycosyltransferase